MAYWAIGLLRSNVWRTIQLAYSDDHVTTSSCPDALVELAEVVADLLVVDRRTAAQHAGVLDDPPEGRSIVVERGGLDHADERCHLVLGEVLDQSEVEEGDPPALVEQVVAGMWITVEPVHAVQAAEHEAEQALAGEVALVLRPLEHLLPGRAIDELAGEHPRRRMRRRAPAGTWMNG